MQEAREATGMGKRYGRKGYPWSIIRTVDPEKEIAAVPDRPAGTLHILIKDAIAADWEPRGAA